MSDQSRAAAGTRGGAASPSADTIMQLGFGFWGSKTLLSAIELGLFTELAQGPLDAAAVAGRLRLHRRAVRDFLDALVALGMLERNGSLYSNTPSTSTFLDRNKPSYIGGILEMANARLYPFWGQLTEALRTGEPQNEVRDGRDLFDELYSDPDRLAGFLRAMSGKSAGAGAAIAQRFAWSGSTSFADIGCAEGAVAAIIAEAHPQLRGVGFDLPAVRPHFEAYMTRRGLADRVCFEAGDFFRQPLPAVDVHIMGHILHDWGLEKKRELIAKSFAALPSGGALIVYESLIDDDRRHNAFGLLMSLNMLIETREGFDFTGRDCTGWMRDAGFRETRVEPLTGVESMVVAIK